MRGRKGRKISPADSCGFLQTDSCLSAAPVTLRPSAERIVCHENAAPDAQNKRAPSARTMHSGGTGWSSTTAVVGVKIDRQALPMTTPGSIGAIFTPGAKILTSATKHCLEGMTRLRTFPSVDSVLLYHQGMIGCGPVEHELSGGSLVFDSRLLSGPNDNLSSVN